LTVSTVISDIKGKEVNSKQRYGEAKVQMCTFLTSALMGVSGQLHNVDNLNLSLWTDAQHHLHMGMCVPQEKV
jgi:hypothetical protein